MGYLGNYRDLGQAAAEIQARLPAQLQARCGAAGRAACHLPSDCDLPFRPRPNDAVPSGLYGQPASARRATTRRGRKLSALLAALLFAASGAAQAKIIPALSPSLFDVNNAIGSAVDGDTVIIPAGTATWTSQLVINKGISIIGQTKVNSTAGTATDNTIINYAVPGGKSIISVQSVAGKSYRVSGLTFGGAGAGDLIGLTGNSHSVRFDNCHIKTSAGVTFHVTGTVYGVADHNFIEPPAQVFHMENGTTPTDKAGNIVWSLTADWGSDKFFFMEDNYIYHTAAMGGVTDDTHGAKYVLRHNHIYGTYVATHGTESIHLRGGRAREIYGNDFHHGAPVKPPTTGGLRSGSMLLYNNTWEVLDSGKGFGLQVYRLSNAFGSNQPFRGWQGADGSSPWDANDTDGKGHYVDSGTPFLYDSGTAEAGTTRTVIVDTKKSWTPNDKWQHFGVKHLVDDKINSINGNTSNNLKINTTATYSGQNVDWKAGDHYEIHRCLVALDQSGRGKGDLVGGTDPDWINTVTNSRKWPHQEMEPVYAWSNTTPNAVVKVHGLDFVFKEDRDYYNSPGTVVNGVQTTGVGVGLFANRPTSGVHGTDIVHVTPNDNDVPGTAYWATDVPSKNGSTDKGALYVWRGGAWVLYYQPYTYPHPLTRNLAPPSNLRVAP